MKNKSSKRREIQGRRVEYALRSVEVEDFSFGMFNNKTKTIEKIRENIVTTKKMQVRNVERFVLTDEETIVDER